MATYAEIAKPNTEEENTQTEFIPKDTVIFDVREIMEVSKKNIIDAVKDLNLWDDSIIGIQRRGDRYEIVTK